MFLTAKDAKKFSTATRISCCQQDVGRLDEVRMVFQCQAAMERIEHAVSVGMTGCNIACPQPDDLKAALESLGYNVLVEYDDEEDNEGRLPGTLYISWRDA